MSTVGKPKWQQLTALVSLSAGGTIAGMSFVPGAHADVTSAGKVPLRLVALERLAQPAQASAPSDDATLRSAIVNVARYYLQMAKDKSPAEMEGMIWQHVSVDGADHGPSCAAFASLTLELGAQVVGQQSWVTEGTTYPWPLHAWADVRVDPNADSLGIISIQQDAQAHGRWHPLGDGYQPQPGDWVMFDGHVEVVTGYSGGVLSTIGGDSLPNYTVNAHDFSGPLGTQGVQGFVDNGSVANGTGTANGVANGSAGAASGAKTGKPNGSGAAAANGGAQGQQAQPSAAIPGVSLSPEAAGGQPAAAPAAAIPGASAAGSPGTPSAQPRGSAAVPGVTGPASGPASDAQPQRPKPASGGSTGHPGHGHAGPGSPAGKAAPAATSPAGDPGNTTGTAGTNGSAAIPGVATAPQPSVAPAASAPADPPSSPARPPAPPAGAPAPPAGAPATPAGAPAAPAASGSTAQARSSAAIPGITGAAQPPSAPAPATQAPAPGSSQPQYTPPASETSPQRAFIAQVAPGAMATQHDYGVPAAVTIAQAILESGWGTSHLSSADHNLFGMKGRGPAGSDALPTQEYQNGQWVTTTALFRKYDNYAESIDDHGRLLATSGYYKRAMAAGLNADAFANALTGVYATDPDYGAKLISLMNEFDLYQFDTAPAAAPAVTPTPARATPTPTSRARPTPVKSRTAPAQPATSPAPTAPAPRPTPAKRATPAPRPSPAPRATPAAARRARAAHAPVAATLTAAFRPAAGSSASGSAVTGAAFRPAVAGAAFRPVVAGAALRTPQRPAPARRAIPYVVQIPMQVKNAFVAFAKVPLTSAEPLYRDVASYAGIGWELLAACDWMECEARPDHSPVYGEKLGATNPDGTIYRTKSEALEQCARDLVDLARAVYRIDLSDPGNLSVRDLASAFAAFRWGALLKLHHTSAMEFPYSVAGLTGRHLAMHWPAIDEPNAPDKPGTRFRLRFGAVPTVLCLRYPATAA